jgi:hypothetical protein
MNLNTCLPIILVFSMSGISSSQAVQIENRKDSEIAGDEKSDVVTAETDLANIQGSWELTFESNGKTVRTVKEIKGNKTTLTRYDEKGDVIHAHTSEFKLDVSGRVRIHTFFNLEVTAGEGKGEKFQGPHSYVYALYGDTWIEVQGLLVDQLDNDARLYRWTRLKD